MLLGAIGERLGRSFRVGDPPTLTSHTLGGLPLAVSEIRIDRYNHGLTEPIVGDDAYLIGLQLRDVSHHELWVDGRPAACSAWQRGTTVIYDLAQHPVLYCAEPFHVLAFYVPRCALAEATNEEGPVEPELEFIPGQAVADEPIRYIGELLLSYMQRTRGNQAIVDHLLLALCAHLVEKYGSAKVSRSVAGSWGLAPWQQRRARELMRKHLATGIYLEDIAKACQLSPSAFIKGFRKSLGTSPHQWLLLQRIEHAIELMRSANLPLVDIALTCGFTDQSHFTRIFTKKMGMSPGAYRRVCSKA